MSFQAMPTAASRRSPPAYLLSSGRTGELLAILEGGELTARRTAAASALAADYLARPEAETLVMAGTGRLSLNLIQAHRSVRPVRQVRVWGRNPEKAAAIAREARGPSGSRRRPREDLEEAIRTADIVSCATLSTQPLIRGDWLPAGCHVDLVGGFRPTMREADDSAIRRSTVFVDTRAGATKGKPGTSWSRWRPASWPPRASRRTSTT